MAISTYSELQTAIENWLDRDDLSSRVPEFISLAEADLNRDTKLRHQEVLATTDYTSSGTSRFLSLPNNFLRLYSILIKQKGGNDSTYEHLKYMAPEFMTRYVRQSSGKPYYYTVRQNIELDVLADKSYTLRMHYLKGWDIASDTTNGLLTNHPDVYLYGSLVHAYIFVYEDASHPSVRQYAALFDRAKEQADLLNHKLRDDAELDVTHVAGITGYNDVYEYDIIHGRY